MTGLPDPQTRAEDITQLLTACSPGCLLAQPDSACTCRCGGHYHGAALQMLTRQKPA